jgi:hypothetical protein
MGNEWNSVNFKSFIGHPPSQASSSSYGKVFALRNKRLAAYSSTTYHFSTNLCLRAGQKKCA